MGRRHSSVKTKQPQKINKHPATQTTQTTTTGNQQNTFGNAMKQGLATGVGFGVAQAATSALLKKEDSNLNPIENENEQGQGENKCYNYIELYQKCISTQTEIGESNCHILLDEFKKCSLNL